MVRVPFVYNKMQGQVLAYIFHCGVRATCPYSEAFYFNCRWPECDQMLCSPSSAQAPEGEAQPSTEVDLFISTEKIMVLNTDLKVQHRAGCVK